jgi:hypothetical protein
MPAKTMATKEAAPPGKVFLPAARNLKEAASSFLQKRGWKRSSDVLSVTSLH